MKLSEDLGPNHFLVTHLVDINQTGIRLDAFLKERYRKRSREQLKRAIDSGAITLKRSQGPHMTVGRLKPGLQLVAGDEVQVLSERKAEPEVCFDYCVIYEDEVLLVIDKPPNLPVHPAGRYFFNTLLIHLRTQAHAHPVLSAEREFFLVHRIDKETSGVLVLAKDKKVCAHLTRQFAERTTEKRYLAVVRGVPEMAEFAVDASLKRTTGSRVELKMMVAPLEEGGQSAFTSFHLLETRGNFSLLECLPKTGRQHQIRIHLETAGHPIVGDKLYGISEEDSLRFFERKYLSAEAEEMIRRVLLLPRHALHAAGIRFEHPLSGKLMEFESPLPADLRAFLDRQG